jgi:thermostable 8-oxoguanine DNA glycosylase
MFASIPIIGGPLDGATKDHQIVPIDGAEFTHESHSYVFCFAAWSWEYRGRWQHVEHLGNLITFRSYRELMQRLGELQGRYEITAVESLQIQQKVVAKNSKAFIKYESNHGKPSI